MLCWYLLVLLWQAPGKGFGVLATHLSIPEKKGMAAIGQSFLCTLMKGFEKKK
ncbi:MAG: hypothetical protein Ct9H300mP23_07640 [Nitrospinota bacterium]|nr:MAG: hypothetical protein Ct9H300mP23_07640 [Nitrospinota bacterium]